MQRLVASLAVLIALGIAGTAAAQDTQCRMVRHGAERVMECGVTVVDGRVQRPLSIIIPRAQIRWEPPPLERAARREIVRSTRRSAF